MEQDTRTKLASPVMNAASETAGFPCTRGKLTDLNAWIADAVESPAARACWKIVGAPSHRSDEPETANKRNNVARYSAKMANQKSVWNASFSPTDKNNIKNTNMHDNDQNLE